jgi:methionyl aminopeptidase
MDDAVYENYKRAGKIAADARDYGVALLKPAVRFFDVATKIENRIKENGASLAFPVNIARNTLAAHFSPRHDDKSIFKRGDIVKLDVGAHINGYIADTAVTVELETHVYNKMIQASSAALEKAIALGYRDFAHMQKDADLEFIRQDKRFAELLDKYKAKERV